MNQREKMLAVTVAAAGVLWLGNKGVEKYRATLDRNAAMNVKAIDALDEAHIAVSRGQRARRQLLKWTAQSLPTDREVAESLYQDWLRMSLSGAGLQVTQVSDKSGNSANPQFTELAFDVRAAGTLAQLTDFLYRFYSSVHLHRISGATLTPTDGGQRLDIALTVNALVLPDSKRTDTLAEGEPKALASPLEELRTRVVSRNLFAAYQPKTEKGPEGGPDLEAAAAMASNMVTDGERGWRLAVRHKDSGKLAYFHVGDNIQYGRFQGKVVELDGRRVVVETDKGRMEIRLGQSLGEAVALPAPAPAA